MLSAATLEIQPPVMQQPPSEVACEQSGQRRAGPVRNGQPGGEPATTQARQASRRQSAPLRAPRRPAAGPRRPCPPAALARPGHAVRSLRSPRLPVVRWTADKGWSVLTSPAWLLLGSGVVRPGPGGWAASIWWGSKAGAGGLLARGASVIMPVSDLVNLSGLLDEAWFRSGLHAKRGVLRLTRLWPPSV